MWSQQKVATRVLAGPTAFPPAPLAPPLSRQQLFQHRKVDEGGARGLPAKCGPVRQKLGFHRNHRHDQKRPPDSDSRPEILRQAGKGGIVSGAGTVSKHQRITWAFVTYVAFWGKGTSLCKCTMSRSPLAPFRLALPTPSHESPVHEPTNARYMYSVWCIFIEAIVATTHPATLVFRIADAR